MPHYAIRPVGQALDSRSLQSEDAAELIRIVQSLNLCEADIECDGAYSFSMSLGDSGVWRIFKRPEAAQKITPSPQVREGGTMITQNG